MEDPIIAGRKGAAGLINALKGGDKRWLPKDDTLFATKKSI